MLKNKIRYHRKKCKLTQAELASKVKVTQPAIANLEAGRMNPSLLTVSRLAKVFKLKPWELLK